MVPDGWNHALLQDVCGEKIVYGIVQAGEHVDAGIPYIKSSDVGGAINAGALAKTALDIHRRYKRSTVEPGDIIFSLRGNTGATSIVPPDLPEANLTQGTARIAVNGKAFGPFLRYQLGSHSVRANIYAVSKGSTFTEISLADLRKIRVLLPPLPEQKKIAEILSTWDRAIETVEALLATARTQKRALMQTLLTGKRRFPEFEGQEWREVRFEEVFDRVRRKNSVGNENVLTISGQDGLVSQQEYFNKRVAAADLSGYTLLVGGDFAYNKSYSAGYPMGAIKMLPDGKSGVVSSLYLCFALAKPDAHCREFFRHFFEAGCFNHEIYKIAQEGARNHGLLNVSVTDFFRAKIRIPDREEQCRIADAINLAEREEARDLAVLEKLRTEKKALMQQLLTGKRRVALE